MTFSRPTGCARHSAADGRSAGPIVLRWQLWIAPPRRNGSRPYWRLAAVGRAKPQLPSPKAPFLAGSAPLPGGRPPSAASQQQARYRAPLHNTSAACRPEAQPVGLAVAAQPRSGCRWHAAAALMDPSERSEGLEPLAASPGSRGQLAPLAIWPRKAWEASVASLSVHWTQDCCDATCPQLLRSSQGTTAIATAAGSRLSGCPILDLRLCRAPRRSSCARRASDGATYGSPTGPEGGRPAKARPGGKPQHMDRPAATRRSVFGLSPCWLPPSEGG